MSLRRRAYIRNLAAMPREALERRARVALGRDQAFAIGGTPVVLPPDSRLPYYQWRDPNYDAYAAHLLRAAASEAGHLTLVDIGGNVGDTAVLALSAAENIDVVTVEGSPYFLDYLRRNVAAFGSRVEVVEGFVGPVDGNLLYQRDGSSGGFQQVAANSDDAVEVTSWISVDDVLARATGDFSVWKTDTDGFDIHLVSRHWDSITDMCDVVWMEYDPVGTLGPKEDIEKLIEQIASSKRELHIYDNVGHHMSSAVGAPAARMLRELTGWLGERRQGFAPVLYFDIWIAEADVASRMWPRE